MKACPQDNEAVLEHLMARRDVKRALAVLRRPNVSQELLYKFAPALMEAAPEEAVTAFITAQPALDAPRCLLPPIPACLRSAALCTHLIPRRLPPSDPVSLQHILSAPLCIAKLVCLTLPSAGEAATDALPTSSLQPAALPPPQYLSTGTVGCCCRPCCTLVGGPPQAGVLHTMPCPSQFMS